MTEELAVQGNFHTDTWLQFAAADTALAVFAQYLNVQTFMVTDYWLFPHVHIVSSRASDFSHPYDSLEDSFTNIKVTSKLFELQFYERT